MTTSGTQQSNPSHWLRHSFTQRSTWVMAGMALFLAGCGGTSTRAQSQVKKPSPVPSLTKLIEAKGVAQQRKALVTIALFGGSELDDEDALKRRLGQFSARYKAQGKPIPQVTEVSVVSTPIDASLPFDLASLASQAGDAKERLMSATQVVFVRFAGSPIRQHGQIRFTLRFVESLAEGSNQAIVDFSTRRVYTETTYSDWVKRDTQLADQVTPGIERSADGVTFFTRGFAKFGHPDLEVYGIPAEKARQHFPRFQAAIDTHRNGAFKTVGDDFDGLTLTSCKRDATSYELNCVRLPVNGRSAAPKSRTQ